MYLTVGCSFMGNGNYLGKDIEQLILRDVKYDQ